MSRRVTIIPGDGIGPEVVEAARSVVDALKLGFTWDYQEAGLAAQSSSGDALPEKTLESIRANKVALKGPTTTPVGSGHKSANVRLRQALELFASIRPVRSWAGVSSRYTNVDLLVVRENTEGLYKGLEHEITPGTVVSLKVVTQKASRRIAEAAFRLARAQGRQKVTVAHKANILKLGDGLFLNCAREVASSFSDVPINDMIVDGLCMKLVANPSAFDVILAENLYGDILSDLCAGLVGGLGLAPGANIGEDAAVFEAVHGSAPDIAGKGIANPIAMILSASLMLRHMEKIRAANSIDAAVAKCLLEGTTKTPDLGGGATTKELTRAIIEQI